MVCAVCVTWGLGAQEARGGGRIEGGAGAGVYSGWLALDAARRYDVISFASASGLRSFGPVSG